MKKWQELSEAERRNVLAQLEDYGPGACHAAYCAAIEALRELATTATHARREQGAATIPATTAKPSEWRDRPPTVEEAGAHGAAFGVWGYDAGLWMLSHAGGIQIVVVRVEDGCLLIDEESPSETLEPLWNVRFRPLSPDGTPVAWPEVVP